jgi:hydroxysqualene synthase
MSNAAELSSGKTHRDENFPVASLLIRARHRPTILAFYNFARAADDVADHPAASAEKKLALLNAMQRALIEGGGEDREVLALRKTLEQHGLTNQHALGLLEAFRRDATKSRYANWDELMDYCCYSAMPVGRFVLDVHGESETTWKASDALCVALQIINHLQDCGKDIRTLDRVYIPLDMLNSAGLGPETLMESRASLPLLEVIRELARQNAGLLAQSRMFSDQIRDSRLALEVAIIQALAEDLNLRLMERDPLSERVHHTRAEAVGLALRAASRFAAGRARSKGQEYFFARQP